MSNHSFNLKSQTGNCDVQIIVHGDATLADVVDAFEHFLYAAGYRLPDGAHLGYEYDEEIERAY